MAIDQLNTNSAANNGVQRGLNGNSAVSRNDRQQAPNTPEAEARPSQSSVSISPEANRLASLESEINATADVDSQRVEDIRRAIADGSFQINADRIAGNLLDQDDFFV